MQIHLGRTLLAVLGLGLVTAHSAHADQCAWLEPGAAQQVSAHVDVGDEVVSYCAPCGDSVPSAPRLVTTMDIRNAGEGAYREVMINAQPVDLAYTYVDRGDHGTKRFVNLADLVGCPMDGSPHVLAMAAPLVPPAAPTLAPAPTPAAAPCAAATSIAREPVTRSNPPTQIQIVFAPRLLTTYLVISMSALFGAALVFLLAHFRRRRSSGRLGSLARGEREQ